MAKRFRERIREARIAAGITTNAVADRAGISSGHLSNIETGRMEPGVIVEMKLAAAVGVMPPYPMQPLVLDEHGVPRFRKNPIVRHLLDSYAPGVNELAARGFSDEDFEHFYQLIGYSIGGFGELDFASDEVYDAADDAAAELLKVKARMPA